MTEIAPGDLCRSAMYDNPAAMAAAIVTWNPPSGVDVAAWLRAVAAVLDPVDERDVAVS